MKKQFNKKKLMTFGILGLFAFVLVSASVFTFVFKAEQEVIVEQSLSVNGNPSDAEVSNSYSIFNGWEQKETSDAYVITNVADRDLNVDVTSTADDGITVSHDTVGLSTTWSSDSSSFADASLSGSVVTLIADKNDGSTASEARITIDASDVGIITLNDLGSLSWAVTNGAGYAPHVDVFLDFDNDGVADDVLVFEHAKLSNADCDNTAIYPIGSYNTFDGKGIVDNSAKAWLGSGPPGGCTTPTFVANWFTLSDWKAGGHSSGIRGTTKVLRLEIEVDGWGQFPSTTGSSADISNIMINGESKEISTQSNTITVEKNDGKEVFYVNSVFADNLEADKYDIITIVA